MALTPLKTAISRIDRALINPASMRSNWVTLVAFQHHKLENMNKLKKLENPNGNCLKTPPESTNSKFMYNAGSKATSKDHVKKMTVISNLSLFVQGLMNRHLIESQTS